MAATNRIGYYARTIQSLTQCSDREAELLEEIVRRHVLHSPTLDWVRSEQFRAATFEALAILTDFRAAGDMPEQWRLFLAGKPATL